MIVVWLSFTIYGSIHYAVCACVGVWVCGCVGVWGLAVTGFCCVAMLMQDFVCQSPG